MTITSSIFAQDGILSTACLSPINMFARFCPLRLKTFPCLPIKAVISRTIRQTNVNSVVSRPEIAVKKKKKLQAKPGVEIKMPVIPIKMQNPLVYASE